MTYSIGDIFKNDSEYLERSNWADKNNATISFYEDRLEEVEKTRTVETYEEQEQVIPAEYDEEGNLIKEETTEVVQVPVTKEETYTEQELVPYYQLVAIPEPTLDELKLAKREEINKARDIAEQGGFEYLGKIFDSDIVSCVRIQGAAQSMQVLAMSEQNPTITWTTKDNKTVDLKASELLELSVALANWSNVCHQKATELKAKIDVATSKEELDKIIWE